MKTLWLVEIDPEDWDYDAFVEAAVWAETPEEAEALVRSEQRYGDESFLKDKLWIEPHWRLHVRSAPLDGVVLIHWHAG